MTWQDSKASDQYLEPDGSVSHGFSVWDNPGLASSTVTFDQVLRVYEQLSAVFLLGPLQFVPNSANQRAASDDWSSGYFPLRGVETEIDSEVYTPGEAYGTVRLYDLASLAAATEAAEYGYQDLLILEEVPLDIETVVSAVVTGARQGTLSHINVRSAARGTPNCFVRDPHPELAVWEGQLVRFECGSESYSIQSATLEGAEDWWENLRPAPVQLPEPDVETQALVGLLALPTDTPEERQAAVATYGFEGTNLVMLYQRIDKDWQLEGFAVPFHPYQSFIEENTWLVDLGQGTEEHSLRETLDTWHADPDFLADAALRRTLLADLQAAMEDAPIDPALIDELALQIREI